MILYHGSNIEVTAPDLKHSRSSVDFGCGFYTTPIHEQAANWCRRFIRRGDPGIVSCYDFDETALQDLAVLRFDSYSEEWLDFIMSCRNEEDTSAYDIVIGGVANDKVFNTIELYFDSLIDKKEAINRLKYEKPNLQICFRSDKAISYLHFTGSEAL